MPYRRSVYEEAVPGGFTAALSGALEGGVQGFAAGSKLRTARDAEDLRRRRAGGLPQAEWDAQQMTEDRLADKAKSVSPAGGAPLIPGMGYVPATANIAPLPLGQTPRTGMGVRPSAPMPAGSEFRGAGSVPLTTHLDAQPTTHLDAQPTTVPASFSEALAAAPAARKRTPDRDLIRSGGWVYDPARAADISGYGEERARQDLVGAIQRHGETPADADLISRMSPTVQGQALFPRQTSGLSPDEWDRRQGVAADLRDRGDASRYARRAPERAARLQASDASRAALARYRATMAGLTARGLTLRENSDEDRSVKDYETSLNNEVALLRGQQTALQGANFGMGPRTPEEVSDLEDITARLREIGTLKSEVTELRAGNATGVTPPGRRRTVVTPVTPVTPAAGAHPKPR